MQPRKILENQVRSSTKWLGKLFFVCTVVLAIVCFHSASAQDIANDPRYAETWKKSQALRDQLSMDATPVEFSIGGVHYKVPRNYIVNMDNFSGGPQTLVAFKVSFPGFQPYTEATKDCFTLAPLYRPKGCVPVEFNIIGGIAVSDDEGFKNIRDLFLSQTPKQGPNGFELYEEGPVDARLNIYRKKTPNHTLIIGCFVHDINRPLVWVCTHESRLPNQNAIHYMLSGAQYEFNGQQFQYAEQIDEGLRSLIDSFTLKGDKP